LVTAATVAASAAVPAGADVETGADVSTGALVVGAGADEDVVVVSEELPPVLAFEPPLLLHPVAARAMAPRRPVVASSFVERMTVTVPCSSSADHGVGRKLTVVLLDPSARHKHGTVTVRSPNDMLGS
jgi:hypothetical protein